MPTRSPSLGLALLLLGAVLTSGVMIGGAPEARADEAPASKDAMAIDVGVALEATRDVKLQRAELGKGSRVVVAEVHREDGRVTRVDLELPDGHVVPKVALGTVVRAFRVVDES